jgi:hypothetical protein
MILLEVITDIYGLTPWWPQQRNNFESLIGKLGWVGLPIQTLRGCWPWDKGILPDMTEKMLRGIQMMMKRENMIDNSKGGPEM